MMARQLHFIVHVDACCQVAATLAARLVLAVGREAPAAMRRVYIAGPSLLEYLLGTVRMVRSSALQKPIARQSGAWFASTRFRASAESAVLHKSRQLK
jgi:hypothetical protein